MKQDFAVLLTRLLMLFNNPVLGAPSGVHHKETLHFKQNLPGLLQLMGYLLTKEKVHCTFMNLRKHLQIAVKNMCLPT